MVYSKVTLPIPFTTNKNCANVHWRYHAGWGLFALYLCLKAFFQSQDPVFMAKKTSKISAIILTLCLAALVGFALYKLSGRAVPADFVRPFLAVLAVSFSAWCLFRRRKKLLGSLVFYVCGLPASLLTLLTYLYYVTIGAVFTGDDVVAIKQSNPEEIWDFLSHYIFNFPSLGVTAGVWLVYVLLVRTSIKGFMPAPAPQALRRSFKVKDLEGNEALKTDITSQRKRAVETTATSAADHLTDDNHADASAAALYTPLPEQTSSLSKTTLPKSTELLSQVANKPQHIPRHKVRPNHQPQLTPRQLFFKRCAKGLTWAGAMVFLIAALVLYTQFRPVAYYRLMAQDLQNKIETFNRLVKEIESSGTFAATKQGTGELYVLIIGESLSRDSMGVYNKSIPNTPFLNKLEQDGRTVVFPNAYSSFVNTVPSITASFSQGNIATGLTFPQGGNLISLAKQAGITTYWISNQVKNGNADTPIGAISALSDHSYFTTNYVFDGSYSQQPDMILLPKLKETFDSLDSTKNNLVIIHLMGSHSPYYNRYPSDYPAVEIDTSAQIGSLIYQPNFKDRLVGGNDYENYLTSIKYNDELLSKIHEMYSQREDFQAMVYYSDHGEALLYDSLKDAAQGGNTPAGRHNVAQFSFAMTRVPLIINMSQQFADKYPVTFKALFNNQEQIFTNDTLYDLMLDLMQVETEAINHQLSIASPLYDRHDAMQVQLLNQKIVGQDPDYMAFAHARLPHGNKLTIKNANSLFKANLALSKGYQNLHVNVALHQDKLYVRALQKFNSDFIELKEFVNQLEGTPNLLLDFDESSISQQPRHQIAQKICDIFLELTPEQQGRIYFLTENATLLNIMIKYLARHANALPESLKQAAANLKPIASHQLTAKQKAQASEQISLDNCDSQDDSQESADTRPALTPPDSRIEITMEMVQSLNEQTAAANRQAAQAQGANSQAQNKGFHAEPCWFVDQDGHVIASGAAPCDIESQAQLSSDQPNPKQIALLTAMRGCHVESFNHDGLPVKLGLQVVSLNQLSKIDELPIMIHYIAFDEDMLSSINVAALCGRHLITFDHDLAVQDPEFKEKALQLRQRLPSEFVVVNYYNAFDSDFD